MDAARSPRCGVWKRRIQGGKKKVHPPTMIVFWGVRDVCGIARRFVAKKKSKLTVFLGVAGRLMRIHYLKSSQRSAARRASSGFFVIFVNDDQVFTRKIQPKNKLVPKLTFRVVNWNFAHPLSGVCWVAALGSQAYWINQVFNCWFRLPHRWFSNSWSIVMQGLLQPPTEIHEWKLTKNCSSSNNLEPEIIPLKINFRVSRDTYIYMYTIYIYIYSIYIYISTYA